MAETLGFEAKVQGLVDYYRALEELDPRNPEHGDVANPDVFYSGGGFNAGMRLEKAKGGALFDIACHARVEYSRRGFNTADLREDTDELRAQRADVLAVMTSPLETAVREQRAERIAGVLGSLTAGQTLRVTAYDSFRSRYEAPRDIAIDPSRALFGTFVNGHISDRVLTVMYDSPETLASTKNAGSVGEHVMRIDVPALLGDEGLLLETLAA
jgi:hypothetical protein